jgi:GTP-binding protein HflX
VIEETKPLPERAIAVAVSRKGLSHRQLTMEHLDELEFLAEAAGADVIMKIVQELEKPHTALYLGKGKLEELKETVKEEDVKLVIIDDDLSPMQARNLEQHLEVKVIDRSGLILDIFASRAKTQEAKVQVELAQLQYIMPRLTRMWTHLSKQYGGVGTKGPGETQIETDRRIIKTRIQRLKEKLQDVETHKEQQRKGRANMPRFALVGYTNAGKSTLMNALTNAGVVAENKLFATLDTTVRSFELPTGQKALLSDTVGFIRKLPTHLVASFRSTLAEAAEADVIVHVIDISHPQFRDQIDVVLQTLKDLKIEGKPQVMVFNKIDALEDKDIMREVQNDYPDAVFISAGRNMNLRRLADELQEKYNEQSNVLKLVVPYTEMKLLAQIYDRGEVIKREDRDEGVALEVKVPHEDCSKFNEMSERYIVKEKQ